MRLIRYGPRMSGGGAFLMGMAGALAGGVLGTAMARAAKPLALAVIKQSVILRQNVRARAEELREDYDDLVARATHEVEVERRATQDRTPPEDA